MKWFFGSLRIAGTLFGSLAGVGIYVFGFGLHILTGLALMSVHGFWWGVVAFGAPVLAELFAIFDISIHRGTWWHPYNQACLVYIGLWLLIPISAAISHLADNRLMAYEREESI